MQLGLGQMEFRGGQFDFEAVLLVVESQQDLARVDHLPFLDKHLDHPAGKLGS